MATPEQILKRQPMGLGDLLDELAKKDWPKLVYLHPIDFLAIRASYIPQNDWFVDHDRSYFLLGSIRVESRVSPAIKAVDLSDWAPSRIIELS